METKIKVFLSFDVDASFHEGIERVKTILGFGAGDGIAVSAVEGNRTGVTLHGGRAVIY